MLKFGEVSNFVQAVAIMRQNQKEYFLHKNYNNLLSAKHWEKEVDEQLKTLSKSIEQKKKEIMERAQQKLIEEKDETR